MLASKPLPDIKNIQDRLEFIFPEGISDRNYVIREMAAKVIFVMLYINAIESYNVWMAPKHVYRFTFQQIRMQEDNQRTRYTIDCMRSGFKSEGIPWFADNTREPVRDETLKNGLISKNAAIIKPDVPTTSSKGRYALKQEFANLFLLDETSFSDAAHEWQKNYLSKSELSRVEILRATHHTENDIAIQLPNGENRYLSPGASSTITKAVVEELAKRFFINPQVLWISESGNKVSIQDDILMKKIGLPINQAKLLPDIVIADLGRPNVLIAFIEVVHTDGPMTEARKKDLLAMTSKAGFAPQHTVFITAFEQRNSPALKRRLPAIATDTLIWCMAEPDLLIWLGKEQTLPFQPSTWRP